MQKYELMGMLAAMAVMAAVVVMSLPGKRLNLPLNHAGMGRSP